MHCYMSEGNTYLFLEDCGQVCVDKVSKLLHTLRSKNDADGCLCGASIKGLRHLWMEFACITVYAWILSVFSSIVQLSKYMHVRLTGDSTLVLGVSVYGGLSRLSLY